MKWSAWIGFMKPISQSICDQFFISCIFCAWGAGGAFSRGGS